MNHNKRDMKQFLFTPVLIIVTGLLSCRSVAQVAGKNTGVPVHKTIQLNAGNRFQTIDGFGVNITPAQWRGGNLKTALDSLTDNLGTTLIRFDCFGRANWLDPSKQNAEGSFPADYLKQVYTSPVFKDAWAAFRYLNSKGIEPVFNISGAVPAAWTVANNIKTNRLKNFDAYASMAASLLVWAREKEGLKFSLFMPFNETDLGYPEGPRLLDEDCMPAINAILKKLKENNLGDIQCIIMDDANCNPQRIKNIVTNLTDADKIKGIGVHTYGNGAEEDNRNFWYNLESQYAKANTIIQQSPLKNKSFLLTEYGDLDQSGEIEFEFAWRSTRRLLKCLNDGVTGAIAWDAFDNFHEHDTVWALYGLLKTDTTNWTYTAKQRFYAAKQVYKYVRPGFQRIAIEATENTPAYVYTEWKNTLRNMLLSAYTSPDGKDFTLVGMSNVEADVELEINLTGFAKNITGKPVYYYRTSRNENCVQLQQAGIKDGSVKIIIPEKSIFTITTVQ